jgi:hypothetical protein
VPSSAALSCPITNVVVGSAAGWPTPGARPARRHSWRAAPNLCISAQVPHRLCCLWWGEGSCSGEDASPRPIVDCLVRACPASSVRGKVVAGYAVPALPWHGVAVGRHGSGSSTRRRREPGGREHGSASNASLCRAGRARRCPPIPGLRRAPAAAGSSGRRSCANEGWGIPKAPGAVPDDTDPGPDQARTAVWRAGRERAPLLVDLNTSLAGRPGGARPSGPVTSGSLVASWLHLELAHHVVVLV